METKYQYFKLGCVIRLEILKHCLFLKWRTYTDTHRGSIESVRPGLKIQFNSAYITIHSYGNHVFTLCPLRWKSLVYLLAVPWEIMYIPCVHYLCLFHIWSWIFRLVLGWARQKQTCAVLPSLKVARLILNSNFVVCLDTLSWISKLSLSI